MDVLIGKLKLCNSIEDNNLPILQIIRDRCKKKHSYPFLKNAIESQLHKYVLECVMEESCHSNSVSIQFVSFVII